MEAHVHTVKQTASYRLASVAVDFPFQRCPTLSFCAADCIVNSAALRGRVGGGHESTTSASGSLGHSAAPEHTCGEKTPACGWNGDADYRELLGDGPVKEKPRLRAHP